MVGATGIEPVATAMSRQCSTAELRAKNAHLPNLCPPQKLPRSRRCHSGIKRMATFRKHRRKWQVQVRREGQPALPRTFSYRKDAIAWARDIEAKQERGFTAVDNRALRSSTVDDLLERYVRTITITKRGRAPEAARISRMRRSAVARMSLAAATPDKFAEYRAQRLTEVAPAPVRKEMALFQDALRIE